MRESSGTWDKVFLCVTTCAIVAFFVWKFAAGKPEAMASAKTTFANAVSRLPITNYTQIINAPDRLSLDGSRVRFTGLQVRKADGGGSFWIGRFGEQLLIVASPRLHLSEGDVVDVTGTARAAYHLSPSWQAKNLGVSDLDTLQIAGIYVAADRVRVRRPRPPITWVSARKKTQPA